MFCKNKELSIDWHSKYAEKSGGAEMLDGFISSVIGSNDPDGKLDGQLNYYHVISGKTKDDGDIKAAAMFKESLKTNGSKLLEEGIKDTIVPGLKIIGANTDLAAAEVELVNFDKIKYLILSKCLLKQ